jgi:hypothetical protein
MKKSVLLVLVGVLVGFTQCKKEEVLRPDNSLPQNQTFKVEGFNWVLSDGVLHVENLDTKRKDYYTLFSSTQKEVCLSYVGDAVTSFDLVRQDATLWSFGSNSFVLGNGVVTKNYPYEKTLSGFKVYGMEFGTSRPLEVLFVDESVLVVKTHQAYGSKDGVNYSFYSKLTFVKQGYTCTNCFTEADPNYINGGLLNTINTTTSTIVGTKWLVSKYLDGTGGSNATPTTDVLEFISTNQYTINGGSPRNYTLSGILGNNYSNLTLYGFTTLGGDYSGQVLRSFVEDGEINAAKFVDIFGSNRDKTVWMVKQP